MRGIRGSQRQGLVWLVGAGPGSPDLLTLKALECLQRADVVYYDNLISNEVLDRIRRDAKRVYVGKRRGVEGEAQRVINQMLINDALAGLKVVRLKGGDPLVFGRGGEELEALRSAGINFEVVPGVTAASGSAAVVGIPLTHRDVAHSVRFITAQVSTKTNDIDWVDITGEQQTLVVYMGLSELAVLTRKLVGHGMDEATPVAVVSRASYHDETVVTGTLGNIVSRVELNNVSGPTTIIVGRVVAFAKDLLEDS
jgi:uroporphyrin-III C-methyltransferase/precorrin-2 dehydrogenase/sirohydrochlorin ferrochelatase